MPNITLDEDRTQLNKMKTGTVCGSDHIYIDVLKLLGDESLDYLPQAMDAVLTEGMPQPRGKSELSSLYRGKALCWDVGILEESS